MALNSIVMIFIYILQIVEKCVRFFSIEDENNKKFTERSRQQGEGYFYFERKWAKDIIRLENRCDNEFFF